MIAYTVRRLVHAVFLLLLASVAVFLLLRAVPGDPVQLLADISTSPEALQAARERLHLDDPLPVQYGKWLGGVLTGDLGASLVSGLPVLELIERAWLPTILLASLAALLALAIAVPTGVMAARREGGVADWIISSYTSLVIAIPGFWLAILSILAFGLYLGWLPVGGYVSFSVSPTGALVAMILPVTVLAVELSAGLSRYVKASLLEALGEDYVRTARAKGVPERTVVLRHGLRNSLMPVVTIFGIQFGALLGGTVIIEAVFAWPGLGTLVLQSIQARDYTVVQGCLIVLTAIFVVVTFLTDVVYGALDPRVRVDGGSSDDR